MIDFILAGIIAVSCVYGFFNGGAEAVSNAVLTSGQTAVTLTLSILGAMATWGGVMKLAEKSGLTDRIARLISPVIGLIFRGLDKNSKAFKAIAMNITANLFGLGNAATPLGIEAMKELKAEENCEDTASRNMVLLTVINTSSIELIPSTVAALRVTYGSGSPMDILPCVLTVSVLSLTAAIMCAYAFDKIGRRKK
ncbi:MAG: spore maturation protein A [Oscillospiraceae bacterium]|nr:spore maturation protein A [Oscillospiraceae bacterium]